MLQTNSVGTAKKTDEPSIGSVLPQTALRQPRQPPERSI
jgi:hypothetical protein